MALGTRLLPAPGGPGAHCLRGTNGAEPVNGSPARHSSLHFLRRLFPPPRRRVTLKAALPLVAFLVAFLGGCLWLHATNRLVFSSPWAFVLVLAAPWVWWLHLAGYSGLRGVRALVALIVRLVVLATLIMALADPRAVRKSNALSLIYALDLSDSIGEKALEGAMKFVLNSAKGKPEKDEAGLVVFGREAAVELPPRICFPFEAVNSRVARDGTNLEKALSLAAAMLPDTHHGRIVLVSDGAATEGSLARVLDDLNARQIPVDVLPIEYDLEHEVWLEKLELPRTVKLGETYEAAVILSSLRPGSGTLTLTENGQKIAEQKLAFEAGKNRYSLRLSLRNPGFYEYVASIEVPPDRDCWQKNNVAVNHVYLKGKGKVLLVTDSGGDKRDWTPLATALRRGQREVEQASGVAFPRDAPSLLPYDCIIFVNVAADAFDVVQLQALRDAVYHQGTGFLMVGGKNSFGPGGYHRTPVEQVLPVSLDISQRKVLPAGALVFVVDRSGSMQQDVRGAGATQQQLANRATVLAMRTLFPRDWVGVIAFDTTRQWIVPLQEVTDVEALTRNVWSIAPGGGTDIYPALVDAFAALQKVGPDKAAVRHIVLLSDGESLAGDFPGIARQISGEQMSLSTVAIGDQANQQLLDALARVGGGTPHRVADPRLLPRVLVREAVTIRQSLIQNKDFLAAVHMPSPVLKGIGRLPMLHGLVLTTPKPRAAVVLRVADAEELEPVLATWHFGIGTAAAFTSDLTTNWGADWVNSPLYEPFVNQLLTDIARTATESSLRIQSYAEGSAGVIVVEDYHPETTFLEVSAEVAGPQEKSLAVPLRQVGPRRYQGDFPLWGNGHYHVMAAGVGGGRNERALARFVVAYSPEYLRFRSNPIALEEIRKRTGGRELKGEETGTELFRKPRKSKASSQSVVDWFLLVLACLIPLDVAVRRVQLDWAMIVGRLRLGRKRAVSGETLGALLRRKEEIRFPAAERPPVAQPPSAVTPQAGAPVPHRPSPRPAPTPPASRREEPKPSEPTSTTGRLLAAKKRWKKE